MKKGEGTMKKASVTRKKNEIYKETKANMEKLGTYRSEFEAPIKRYAELRLQFDILNEQWYEEGCRITEEYTNKSGATNQRKTALYLSIETMRKELIDMENIFGLTPKGLKMIKAKGLDKPKGSALEKALVHADEET